MASTEQPTIKVAIVEDQREIRECLAILIGGSTGFACTGSYRSMEEALPRIGREVPNILLLDIGLPGMNGIEGLKILKARFPALVTLMLSVYEDDERIFDALCAGACGYLLKKTSPARILDSIKEAVDGGAPMSPEVATKVVGLFRGIRPPEGASYSLTPHESRLLKLLSEGHNYKSASVALGVSTHTVSFHLRSIYDKLHVHSKTEAVAKALRDRLI